MRIIAGELRGRRLHTPRASAGAAPRTRPSSQRTRTALFDALGAHLRDARVLDLFCGSGALGIEALSRGAALTVFVENSTAALTALRRNLEELGLRERARVLAERAERALARLRQEGERFDLILLDPPYADAAPAPPRAGPAGERGGALAELGVAGARLIAERSRRHSAWELRGWELVEARVHGETRLDSYVWAGDEQTGDLMRVKE